jgi:hypothetical protein
MFTGCLLGFTQLIQACDSDFPAETVAPLRNVTLFFEAQHVHSKKKIFEAQHLCVMNSPPLFFDNKFGRTRS